jgi:Secretion system C-terminal sorting domain
VKRILTKTVVSIIFISLFAGWGSTGHKIINSNITVCFPPSMNFPATWSPFLIAHASDPDNRKGSDPTESPRHFIDIDAYPEFVAHGFISQNYDSVVALHTSYWVIKQGILPWAIVRWEDSLKRAFQQGNWNMAMQLSADLGHYVGDGHQPLHCTQNYDGDMTNQSGVHSRYETKLVGQYQSSIVYTNDSASYVSNISNYVFDFLYLSNKDVDTVLYGDSVAHAADATYGTTYLQKYWDICGNQIIQLMKNASKSTADLIYSAWVDAGSPNPNATSINDNKISPSSFNLYQNYPNPFNPATSIKFSIAEKGNVKLNVYDVNGRKVAELLNGEKEPGNYEISFDASKLSSGVYFYELRSAGFFQSKKMILIK